MLVLRLAVLSCLILSGSVLAAGQDSLQVQENVRQKKDTKFSRFVQSLVNGHVDRTFEKPIDFSFIALPSYSIEGSFGLGGGGMGLYRIDRTDSLTQPSNISAFISASIKGFYDLNITGSNYFPHNNGLLTYAVRTSIKNLRVWGMNFDDCSVNPEIKGKRHEVILDADYVYPVTRHFSAGVAFRLKYRNFFSIDDISYLRDSRTSYVMSGVGLTVQFDSRDVVTYPSKGFYVMARGLIYPSFSGNYGQTVYKGMFVADWYHKLWKGSVLCADLFAELGSSNTPWALKAELGGGSRMRGYYYGGYTDNNIASFQVELRQKIYRRIGCAAWGGVGAAFPAFSRFDVRNILPNYGVGLRFEFKHNVNIRVDYGFGKGPGKRTGGFYFGINESF